VLGLSVNGSTVYAGGTFTNIGGQARNRIAAIDASTGSATAWNPDAGGAGGGGNVRALLVNGSTVYAGGLFYSIGGQTRECLAALDAATGSATSWNPTAGGGDPAVLALSLSGSTVYAGGNFSDMSGLPHSRLAAIRTYQATSHVVPKGGPKYPPIDPARTQLRLARVGPNPTSGITHIEYVLAREASVRVSVYDVMGREIIRLTDDVRPSGRHQVTWNGFGRTGLVSSGVYFIHFESGGDHRAERLVVLR
jgi:hypothetical protein